MAKRDLQLHKDEDGDWVIGDTSIYLTCDGGIWRAGCRLSAYWLVVRDLHAIVFPTRRAAYRTIIAEIHVAIEQGDDPPNALPQPALRRVSSDAWLSEDGRWRIKREITKTQRAQYHVIRNHRIASGGSEPLRLRQAPTLRAAGNLIAHHDQGR